MYIIQKQLLAMIKRILASIFFLEIYLLFYFMHLLNKIEN